MVTVRSSMSPSTREDLRYSADLVGSFRLIWTLQDFSGIDSTTGQEHISSLVPSETNGSTNFYLCIYPGGVTVDDAGFVSLYLHCHNAPECGVHLEASMSIGNVESKTFCRYAISDTITKNKAHGCKKMISHQELLDKLQRDILIVTVDGTYSESVVAENEISQHYPVSSPLTKLLTDLASMYFGVNEPDAVVSVDGPKAVMDPVHETILDGRSWVSDTLFECGDESSWTEKDFEADVAHSLLMYFYYGDVPLLNRELALELLGAADKYSMDDLKDYCTDFLVSHLDDGNVLNVLIAAGKYCARRLSDEAMRYLFRRQDYVKRR